MRNFGWLLVGILLAFVLALASSCSQPAHAQFGSSAIYVPLQESLTGKWHHPARPGEGLDIGFAWNGSDFTVIPTVYYVCGGIERFLYGQASTDGAWRPGLYEIPLYRSVAVQDPAIGPVGQIVIRVEPLSYVDGGAALDVAWFADALASDCPVERFFERHVRLTPPVPGTSLGWCYGAQWPGFGPPPGRSEHCHD